MGILRRRRHLDLVLLVQLAEKIIIILKNSLIVRWKSENSIEIGTLSDNLAVAGSEREN